MLRWGCARRVGHTNIGEEIAQRAHVGSIGIAFRPTELPVRGAKSDVCEPIRGSRRYCGVATATFEEINRSGRKICTMRYFGGITMDIWAEPTRQAEGETIMANRMDHAPRWQRRIGYSPGGVACRYAKETNVRGTSERSAVVGESPRIFTRRRASTRAERKPRAAKWFGDDATSAESDLCSLRRIRSLDATKQTLAKRLRGAAFRQRRHCEFPPGGLSRAGGRKATFADQSREVGALAESPLAQMKKQAGADETFARCVILAESSRIFFHGSGAGSRRTNRSWRINRAARHVGSVALVISPAESTGHSTERR